VLLISCQQASAQNYTALREGVWLPPLSQIDNITEAKEYDGLVEKLPQIKGTRAEQQLQLLSASSRSKLSNLTGSAAEVRHGWTAAGLYAHGVAAVAGSGHVLQGGGVALAEAGPHLQPHHTPRAHLA
jgi:hypothetical protein